MSEIRPEITDILREKLKERDVVEVETTQAIVSRLLAWSKMFASFVAIPLGILLLILAGAGIKSYVDILGLAAKAEQAQKEVEGRINATNKGVEAQIDVFKKSIDDRLDSANKLVTTTQSKTQEILGNLDKLEKQLSENKEQLTNLESKVKGIEFKRSDKLTETLQAKLEDALADFQSYFEKIGYRPAEGAQKVGVRIDEEIKDNAYFDKKDIVLGEDLASNPEFLTTEYAWIVFQGANPKAFDRIWNAPSIQANAFLQGLKLYFVCSYKDEPHFGRDYYRLIGRPEEAEKKPFLFNLENDRAFKPGDTSPESTEPHQLGEIWGGSFWDLRKALGREKADRLLFEAWKGVHLPETGDIGSGFFFDAIEEADKSLNSGNNAAKIREIFDRRKLVL